MAEHILNRPEDEDPPPAQRTVEMRPHKLAKDS